MGIFHACDIRGIAGENLFDDIARKIGLAVGVPSHYSPFGLKGNPNPGYRKSSSYCSQFCQKIFANQLLPKWLSYESNERSFLNHRVRRGQVGLPESCRLF